VGVQYNKKKKKREKKKRKNIQEVGQGESHVGQKGLMKGFWQAKGDLSKKKHLRTGMEALTGCIGISGGHIMRKIPKSMGRNLKTGSEKKRVVKKWGGGKVLRTNKN